MRGRARRRAMPPRAGEGRGGLRPGGRGTLGLGGVRPSGAGRAEGGASVRRAEGGGAKAARA
ncbi:hypothetical protein [Streptomyces yangpuensis]|uniref:hypothetical protein n=1 Tax=Streptomyces yangpuensis TaxID=1648182 RepID=UPI003648F435